MKHTPTSETAAGPVEHQGVWRRLSSGTFGSLTIPAYRYYFIALLGQYAAMNMQMVARSWYVYDLTDSVSLLGVIALANAVPMLSLSLFGGVLADRVQKKNVLIVGQAASAVIALAVALAITLGAISWQYLVVAAFLQGIVMALMMPARQAIIPDLVGQERLTNAVALNAGTMNLLRLLAPAFAGFLIALWNIQGVYYLMAIFYAVGIFFLFPLPSLGTVTIGGQRTWRQVTDGLKYVKRKPELIALLVFTLLATVLSMPYSYLLPAFTQSILTVNVATIGGLTHLPLVGTLFASLGKSSARLGMLISISGVGAVVGSLYIASMPNKKRGILYIASTLIMAGALIFFSITGSYWLAILVFIPLGVGQAGRMTLSNALVQSYTEDSYRGRVMSLYMMNWGLTNVGVFLVSLIAAATGVQLALGGAAALLVIVSIYYLFLTPSIRRLD